VCVRVWVCYQGCTYRSAVAMESRWCVCMYLHVWQDFAASLFTRNVESEEVCNKLTPGHDAAMCIGLPATNPNTMVLSHADAVEIARATPKYAPEGSGGLPLPRTIVEAMGKCI